MRPLRSLIIETDESVSVVLSSLLHAVGVEHIDVERLGRVRSRAPMRADIVFLDARFPEDEALGVVRECRSNSSTPRLVVLGYDAPGSRLFKLAQAGATSYLAHPFDERELNVCIFGRLDTQRRLEGIARSLVGEMTLRDAQQSVRTMMLEEALEATRGSRRSAARLLGVTRPAIQRMMRELSGCPESGGERAVEPRLSK